MSDKNKKSEFIDISVVLEQYEKVSDLLDTCNESFSTYINALEDSTNQEEMENVLECCQKVLKLRTILKSQKDVFDFMLGNNDEFLRVFNSYNS